jgi:hypothetical protein
MRARFSLRRLSARVGEAEQRAAAAQDKESKLERRLEREERLADRLDRARKTEHDWNRDLRRQIAGLQRERGVLGRTDDVRALTMALADTGHSARVGLAVWESGLTGDEVIAAATAPVSSPR